LTVASEIGFIDMDNSTNLINEYEHVSHMLAKLITERKPQNHNTTKPKNHNTTKPKNQNTTIPKHPNIKTLTKVYQSLSVQKYRYIWNMKESL
jgi:hypothetical protein